jgi:endonuclease-3
MSERKIKKIVRFLKGRYGKDIDNNPVKKGELFKLLIGTVLSQRTRDENSEKATENLFSVVKKPEDMIKLSNKKLEKLIRPSGFFKVKAKRIKQISKIILEDYKGKVPRTREELLKLLGVGYKTSDIVLSYGYGVPTIAVDVHVEVCSKRLGLVRKKARYEEIRETLEDLIPQKDRYIINLGFVNFGKEICITRKPRCHICPLNNICDYYAELRNVSNP